MLTHSSRSLLLWPLLLPSSLPTDNAYMNAYSNRSMVDCFKKTNLVTFSNQNKIELICSDDDPINILVRLNFNLCRSCEPFSRQFSRDRNVLFFATLLISFSSLSLSNRKIRTKRPHTPVTRTAVWRFQPPSSQDAFAPGKLDLNKPEDKPMPAQIVEKASPPEVCGKR